MSHLSFQQVQQHLDVHFSRAMHKFTLQAIDSDCIRIERKIYAEDLRPGHSVSGPTLMQIADFAAYVAIIANQGSVDAAFTTNLNINFLRQASADYLIIACAKVLKAGRNLATVDISIYSENSHELIAHATANFALMRKEEKI